MQLLFTFLSGINVLAGVEALGGDHELLLKAVLVAIAESDDGERCATTRVMDDLSDDALNEAVSFGEVDRAKLGGALAVKRMGFEART